MKNLLIINLFLLLSFTISHAMEDETKAIIRLNDSIVSSNHVELKKVISEYPELINRNNPLYLHCSLYNFSHGLSSFPLPAALSVGDVETIRILVDAGADVKNTDGKNDVLDCFISSDFCHNIEIYEILIKAGAKFNAQNIDNYSILHNLARCNKSTILNHILKQNTSPNEQDSRGMTPLHHAVELCTFKCIKVLLSHPNIDLLIKNDKSKNPLSFAKEQFDCYSSDSNPSRRPSASVCTKYKTICRMLIQHLGVYSAQGSISKKGFAQVLPPEIARLIASFLFRG